jgi:hypothetical protein
MPPDMETEPTVIESREQGEPNGVDTSTEPATNERVHDASHPRKKVVVVGLGMVGIAFMSVPLTRAMGRSGADSYFKIVAKN